jgi:hypothetical protein
MVEYIASSVPENQYEPFRHPYQMRNTNKENEVRSPSTIESLLLTETELVNEDYSVQIFRTVRQRHRKKETLRKVTI